MKKILLSQGSVATVDNNDYEWVSQYKWSLVKIQKRRYATTSIKLPNGRKSKMYMHRLILGNIDKGQDIDHIDGNGLNNCRSNLRVATCSQNQANRGISINNTSGYKGIAWRSKVRKWQAKITVGGRFIHLGYFVSKEEAARSYDVAAKLFFGEFAKTNF